MSNAPIGVIDSGVGGLTILKEIQLQFSAESLVYVGDTVNCPYGGKSADAIERLSIELVGRVVDLGAKLVVVACNTISVTCIHELRAAFPAVPIVGTVPVIKTASSISKKRKIGILSTVATANSAYQASLVSEFAADCAVTNVGTNELVPRIEQGLWSTELPEVLPPILAPFQQAEVDALVLGCSHYPILKQEMQAILGPGVAVLDSGAAIARQVGRVLAERGALATSGTPTYRFTTTAESTALPTVLERLEIHTGSAVI